MTRLPWRERPPAGDGIFYALAVPESDDPFFIVPAVQPDDEESGAVEGASTDTHAVGSVDERSATPARAREPIVRRSRRRVRRTTRTLRYIDPWSVLRVAGLFHVVLYLVLLITGVLLWNVANTTGTVDNVERFMESFGWESFEFRGGEIYHQAWVLGLFLVVGLTGLAVLVAVTFNLITDVVGGIRVTVLEDVVDGADESPSTATTGLGAWLRSRRSDR